MAQIKSGNMGGASLGKIASLVGGAITMNPMMITAGVAGDSPLGKMAGIANTISGFSGKGTSPDTVSQADSGKYSLGVDTSMPGSDSSAMGRALSKAQNSPTASIGTALEHLKQPGVLPPDLAMSAVEPLLRAKHGYYGGMQGGV